MPFENAQSISRDCASFFFLTIQGILSWISLAPNEASAELSIQLEQHLKPADEA
jgi:hypothetical protein